MKNSVYILFMNREKNFSIDKKEFETYEEALIWGKLFLENFNVDMIKFY
jgi:hypothetical protein